MRGKCSTCNAFAQAVLRKTRSQLQSENSQRFQILKEQVELEEYQSRYGLDGIGNE